ncbi:hypothetical protein HX801_03385 [Pseudomonas sp. G1002]|nr:hypothetical protein [Pseudomonas sp. G1002]
MNRRNGTKGQRLIELFNALQRRETTFGQIYAMSASCGIDARRVLADCFKFDCSLEFGLAASGLDVLDQIRQKPASGRKDSSPFSSPDKGFSHRFMGATREEFLKDRYTITTVNTDKELGYAVTIKPHLNVYGGTVAKLFIVTAVMKIFICPLPKCASTLLHAHLSLISSAREVLRLINTYTKNKPLSKPHPEKDGFLDVCHPIHKPFGRARRARRGKVR